MVEKDVNLVEALACRDFLEAHGVEVLMSRTTDENDPITDEINECNEFEPDLAIDIHSNSGRGDGFEAFYHGCDKPLLYNGDLHTIEDIQTVTERFPRLAGLVIGRGLLANPALAWEYQQNRKLSPDEMLSKIKQLHTAIYNSYEEQLQGGETQLLMKMKNFWEYLLPNGNRKAQKAIHKTSKLTNYRIAVNDLLSSYQ